MTDTKHPEALRLAALYDADAWPGGLSLNAWAAASAAELRRLHAENTTLQQGYDAARLEIDHLRGAPAPQAAPTSSAQGDALDAMRYRWLAAHCRSTAEHWGGRRSIVVEGPAPKSHDSEDDFDAAIDAAIGATKEKKNGT